MPSTGRDEARISDKSSKADLMEEKLASLSVCGAARLLAAIFGESEHSVLWRWGIRQAPYCPDCGRKLQPNAKRLYCRECGAKHNLVTIECDQCHRLFERKTYWVAVEGKGQCFCSKRCLGKWSGTHYGFTVHPGSRFIRRGKSSRLVISNQGRGNESLYSMF